MRKPFTLCTKPSFSDPEQPSRKKQRPERGLTMRRNGVSPGEYVIRNLMNYSKALSVLNTKETGIVNVVMN
jgi:hypothetical protein